MSDDTSHPRDGESTVIDVVRSSIAMPGDAQKAGHIDALATSPLPAPSKLHLLAYLKANGVEATALEPLALSLVRSDLDDGEGIRVARQLVDHVVYAPGRDPLGRAGLDAGTTTAALLSNLAPTIGSSALSVIPACDAQRVDVRGKPVLSVKTEMWSTAPLSAFEPVIDPREWPKCAVQSHFFEAMDAVTQPVPLSAPDTGWTQTLRETVNFGGQIGRMRTQLAFVFHRNATSIGCTYTLVKSEDKKIEHDDGYLLVEDLQKSRGARRITTLKSVWFTGNNTPADDVCPIWSMAAGLVAHACLQEQP